MKVMFFINILLLISFFSFGFFSIYKLRKLKFDLKNTKLHNQTLQTLYDTIRSFRHDFFNIVQSISGYIKTGNVPALEDYYSEIKFECDNLNNLSTLDPSFINDAAIYNLLTTKYYKAINLGISFDIHFLLKLNTLNISSYTASRILGVLIDNAIEAASNSKEKRIILEVIPIPGFDSSKQLANIVIENTYSNKDVNLDRICEKGFTSKSTESRFSRFRIMECIKIIEKI